MILTVNRYILRRACVFAGLFTACLTAGCAAEKHDG
jgi:hypothetical protein